MACRVATGWADGMVRTGEDVYAKALSLISKMLRRYWCVVAVSYALCTYLTDPGEGGERVFNPEPLYECVR